jgi:flavin-dependent dehydrogenase
LRLGDGSRVCIIGGGPAGSFSALHLLNFAEEFGIRLEVIIFEPRNFAKPGPGGCNRCAGILSTRLLHGLNSIDLQLPDEVIQTNIDTYAVQLAESVIRVNQPDPHRHILSVYRGGGPLQHTGEPLASFDGYLLDQAVLRGAEHIGARIRKVIWDEGKPVVQTARDSFIADLVVLASGVNSKSPLDSTFGYRAPRTAMMAQDEILRPESWSEERVSIFLKKPRGMVFGALIPKDRYINVSILGKNLGKNSVEELFRDHELGAILNNESYSLCGCTPRIAIRPAKKYFGDRWVAVGDAAVTRLYKDGVGSAFFTARAAMRAAIKNGISGADLGEGYSPHYRKVASDNRYGRVLYWLWDLALRNSLFFRVWREMIRREVEDPEVDGLHRRILWGMFSGDEQYRNLFWLILTPQGLAGIWRGFVAALRRRG